MPFAIVLRRSGGPEVLEWIEVPSAALDAGQVRIAVRAAGVNFADIQMRQGLYPEAPPHPYTPGYEVSGTVAEVGVAVKSVRVGDRVIAGCKFGGYATEVVVFAEQVKRIPQGLSFEDAASIPVNFMTAWIALHEMARIRAGDRVAVMSAAGGVGIAALQMVRRAGASATAIVGLPDKARATLEMGATDVVLNQEWESPEFDSYPYDVILDSVGGKSLKRSMRRLGLTGRLISFGVSNMIGEKRSLVRAVRGLISTPLFTPFQLMNSNSGIYGLNALKFFDEPGGPGIFILSRALDQVLERFARGELRACVGRVFEMRDAGSAHTYLQSRANIGKVVLKV